MPNSNPQNRYPSSWNGAAGSDPSEQRPHEATVAPLDPSPGPADAIIPANQPLNSESKMAEALLDVLPVGVWILDSDLRVKAVNLGIQEFFGFPREEFIGQDKRKLVEERIHTIFENGDEFLRRIVATYNQNTYIENFLCHVLPGKNRRERWLEHFSQPIRRNGVIEGRVEIYFDVTDRIGYEEEINWISTQLIQVQEREKARIASNLHNEVGQSVVALKFALERLENSLCDEGRERYLPQIQGIGSQVESIARDISRISEDLLPPSLKSFGIQETLNWMASYYQSLYGIDLEYQVLGAEGKRFPSEVEIGLFRIFQEGLNNVVKHANTNSVQCKLIYSHPRIIALISDQGDGFDPVKNKLGAGLRIMQRRVAELGGTLTIRSQEGEGTHIRAVIPAQAIADKGDRVDAMRQARR